MTDGKRLRRTPGKRDLETVQRDTEIVRLRNKRKSYKEIADELGCAQSTAYRAVARAIAEIPREAVNEMVAMESATLDAVIARLWDVVNADHPYISAGRRIDGVHDAGPVISALAGIQKASESKRKLFGLDAPTKQVVTVITEDAVDAELRRLEEALAAGPATTQDA